MLRSVGPQDKIPSLRSPPSGFKSRLSALRDKQVI